MLAGVQEVAFDLNRNLLYVAFNKFFMFNFVAGLSYFTRLVVNLASVHPSETYICVFQAISVDIRPYWWSSIRNVRITLLGSTGGGTLEMMTSNAAFLQGCNMKIFARVFSSHVFL